MKSLSALSFLIGFALLWFFKDASPFERLFIASLGLLFFVKIAALFWQLAEGVKPKSKLGLLLFIAAWPGVDYRGFVERGSQPPPETGKNFLSSWISMIVAMIFLMGISLHDGGRSTVFNYMALVCVLFIIHMGMVEVMADGFRLLGYSPQSLFERPWRATSLRDFWSFRWNRAFVDMNKMFLLKPLSGRMSGALLVFIIFLVSGLIHEVAISYPDGVSWGFPLLYFAFQGAGVLLEKKLPFKVHAFFILAWILVPVPILFPPAFVNLFLGTLCSEIYRVANLYSFSQIFRGAVFVGGCLHFLVLCASLQVPGQLQWREEFERLRPLNRKVFWTYGIYIFSIILFMSGVSFYLSQAAVLYISSWLWLVFIALFWWARILIDFFYMKHEDWPKGPLFEVGHVCLSTLFITLVFLYTGLAVSMLMFPF